MKIVLISLYNREFAFGVRYLSSVLNRAGYECHIIFFKEMTAHPHPEKEIKLFSHATYAVPPSSIEKQLLIDALKQINPDLVGFSVSSSFFKLAAELSIMVKNSIPIPLIWGGIHPTLQPEPCLEYSDYVCVGEGEGSIPILLKMIESGGPEVPVKGIVYHDRSGNLLNGGPGPYVEDLDSLPFPDFYDSMGNKHYISTNSYSGEMPERAEYTNYSYNMMTLRGCHFGCSYCCNSILRKIGRQTRRRSPESVIEELRLFTCRPDIEHVHFWDNIFTFDTEWIEKFATLYRNQIGLPMTCYVHPKMSSSVILRKLKWAGLVTANVGIQSGSPTTLKESFGRYYEPGLLLKVAQLLQELDIKPYYDLILDNPYEDSNDYRTTLDLVLSMPRPFELNTYSMCFFPETPLTMRAVADGKITEDQVEGNDNKAVREFVAHSRERDKRQIYWDTLIGMSQHGFFPKRIIRFLSRLRFLEIFPSLLLMPVLLILKSVRCIHPQRKLYNRFFPSHKPQQENSLIKLLNVNHGNGQGIGINVSISGNDKNGIKSVLSLDLYPAYEGRHPARHVGYWNIDVSTTQESKEVAIEIKWPEVRFKLNGTWEKPSEKWRGSFLEEELYNLQLLLYDERGKLLDCLSLRTDPGIIFRGEQGRIFETAVEL